MALGIRELIRLSLSRSTGKWLFLGGGVGIICGLVGFAFHLAVETVAHFVLNGLAGCHPVAPPGEVPVFAHSEGSLNPVLLIVVLVLGGLVSGLICLRSPDARGGGTGAAVRAFHHHQGRITLGASLAKFFASAATLGTGGSAGREGPISLIGAGFGSWFADRLGLAVRDRRILLAAGIAGGVAALFRAPLAGALYAAEVLYSDSELEAEVLIPAFIAAIIAFCTFGFAEAAFLHQDLDLLGGALFQVTGNVGFSASRWQELGGYLILVFALAFAARLFLRIEHAAHHRFQLMALPIWARPAVGAAATGAIALLVMAATTMLDLPGIDGQSPMGILGSGYGIIQTAIDGGALEAAVRWWMVGLFCFIALGKMVATACTVGSGGSGGEFAPSIVIGGCIGAAVGYALHGLPVAPSVASCVIMGMAGFLAATHRTPIAALLMVSEITGSYGLLIPAMWVTALSFLVSGRITIVAGQVASPLSSPAHRGHFFNDLLAGILVKEILVAEQVSHTLKPGSRLSECRQLLRDSSQTVFPVVDDDGKLVGEVTLDDLRAFLYDQDLDLVAVAQDVMSAQKWSVTPEDTLAVAMRRFNVANLDELPVIERKTDRFLGLLTRRSCIGHYNKIVDQLRAQRRAEGYETEGAVE